MAQASLRLRAARLAAGYVVSKDAAAAVGVSLPAYRSSEGTRLTENVLHRAANTFGVTPRYLATGEIDNELDRLADRLHAVIVAAAHGVDQGEAALRLREMRFAAGFGTMLEACDKFGWPNTTYSNHESGYSTIPLDRLIGYALSLGGRPEYLVSGQLPVLDENTTSWVNLRNSDALPEDKATLGWYWLRSTAPGLPILVFKNGVVLVSEDRLQLPAEMLRDSKRGTGDNRYVYLPPTSDGTMYIVNATEVGGKLLYVDENDGSASIRQGPGDTTPKDPIRKRTGGEFYLGGLVRRLRLVDDGDS